MLALGGVVLIGLVNGFLIAYADVPAIFATLASGAFVFGFVRSQLIGQDAIPVPPQHWVETLGRARFLSIPVEVFLFAAIAFLAFLFLRFTKWGRYVYLMGDNPMAARNMGIPVRPMIVLRYVLSAVIAFAAGILTAASLLSINTRVVNSTLLYDIILVVVIGGIGLSGGQGRHAQRHRRRAADRHHAECHDHPRHSEHLSEPDQVDDPADRHHHRQRPQSARRADGAARATSDETAVRGKHRSKRRQREERETQ